MGRKGKEGEKRRERYVYGSARKNPRSVLRSLTSLRNSRMLVIYSVTFALASVLVEWVDSPRTHSLTQQANSHCMF